nr:neuronal acetylcholine receptor subunit alpha-7-like [Lytechinus pictus]
MIESLLICWICWMPFHSVDVIADNDRVRMTKIKLHNDLISNYGPTTIPPYTDNSSSVNVKMRMLVDHIVQFDEPNQQVTLYSAIKMIWRDDHLSWNRSDYPDVAFLEVDVDKIWSPTVTLLTSNSPDFLSLNHRQVEISSDGTVSWLSPAVITSTCLFDVTLFPFDVQKCVFEFGPWASPHNEEDLDFFFERNETTIDRYRENGVWEIVKDTVKKEYVSYSSHEEPFAEIHYHITFRRKSKVYVLGIVIPSVLLSVSTMIIFLLPPESGEKISFGITNLLAMVLFQETVRSAMPPTGSPILANYICVMVIIACTSIIIEAIVLRMHNVGNARDLPRWVERAFLRKSQTVSTTDPVPNGSIVIHPDDEHGKHLCDYDERHQSSNTDDRMDNAELWKMVALSLETKAALVTLCGIAGNIAFTSLHVTILYATK